MLPLALAVLLETRLATLDVALPTVAQASPRPHECRNANGAGSGLWLRLRDGDAQHYCDLLARGYARLEKSPNEALRAGEQAEAVAGRVSASRVLRGRALLRLARTQPAYEEFAAAEASDAHAFTDPKALHDYARSASLAQKPAQAARLYRLLISRIELLDDPRERIFCQIEAAAHVLPLPGGADEALGYLSEARRQPLGLSAWVNGLRALALLQSGRAESREPSVADALGPLPARDVASEVPLLPVGTFEAMRAALTSGASRPVAPKKKEKSQ